MKIAKITMLMTLALCFTIVTPLYGQQIWCDGFESYTPGSSICGPAWICSGNYYAIADNTVSYTGNQSVLMYGVVGACWATVADRPLETYFPMAIEFAVRNGSEDLGGCHLARASADLRAGSVWTDPTALTLLRFSENGDLVITLPNPNVTIPGFSLEQWYYFRIEVWIADDGYVYGGYWVDEEFLGEYSRDVTEFPHLENATHLDLAAQEGTVWFDAVCVITLTEAEIPTLSEWGMIIMALLLLAVGTVAVVRNRKAAVSRVS